MKALIVLLALVATSYAYQDCDLPGLDMGWGSVTNDKSINDDFNGIFLRLNVSDITEVKVTRPKYLDASIQGDEIIFYTTEKFKDIEYEMQQTSRPQISFEISFYCKEGYSQVTFIQPINDINNHVPTFNRKVYTYKFGMPSIAKGFHLNELLDIIAVDVDLTDTNVEFSIEKQDMLEIKKLSSNYDKIFRAKLTTLKELVKPFNKSFTITVKDPRSDTVGTALVNIILL